MTKLEKRAGAIVQHEGPKPLYEVAIEALRATRVEALEEEREACVKALGSEALIKSDQEEENYLVYNYNNAVLDCIRILRARKDSHE